MKKWIDALLNLFFPPLCVVCSDRLSAVEKHICIECLSKIPRTNFHKQEDNRLEEFFAGRFPFKRIISFAYYVRGGSIQQIIHHLKYKNNREVGVLIGRLYGRDLANTAFIADIDFLVPVPLHRKRERQRGYNQSLAIAEGLAQETNRQVDTTTLVRTVNNKSQTKNTRFDRWKNVENIFEVTDITTFEGKHILLVDDVITTGSTLESCARELLKNCNCTISVLSIGAAT